jgi:GDP-L-fucose synthase
MTGPLLVTGGTGLLGSAILALRPDAVCLSQADGDFRDRCYTERLFNDIRPGQILHLAALVGGVQANAARNGHFFEDNLLINTNVLAAARRLRVPRLVTALSSCAFSFYPDRPTTEDDLHHGVPFDGNVGYATAKRMLDLHIHLASRDHGCEWTSLTPVSMYGPRDNFDLQDGHVIGSLIHRCWLAKREKTPLVVWGSGEAIRQFVFVKDVARLMVAALTSEPAPETVIVAPDAGVTIRMLAQLIAKAMQFNGPIQYDRTKPEGVRVKRLASRSFGTRFTEFRFTDLEAGLQETVEWFEAAMARGRDVACAPAFTMASGR